MQFSELTRVAERQLSVSWDFIIVWPLCVHGEFRDVKSNNNISNFAFLSTFCKHNNVERDRDWTIVVQVFISIFLNYVTCEILIHLVHN